MTPAVIIGFLAASALLAVMPGPGVFYIVTRTLAHGRAAGLASVTGVAAGNFGSALLAAAGLAALLEVSRLAFVALTWAGAVYLIALGARLVWRAVRSPSAVAPVEALHAAASRCRLGWNGFVVALLNPKTTMFFGAFLPQFIDASRPALPQSMAFGAAFVAIAACSDAAYVLAAHRLGAVIASHRSGTTRLGQAAAGGSLIALGLLGGLTGQRRPT